MERSIEWFVALTAPVIAMSHILRPGDWAEAYGHLYRLGRPGAFVNGGLSLVPGAAIVAGHGSWTWPGAVLTAFGWLMIAKAVMCFLAPGKALRSMERGSRSPRGFIAGGFLLLAIAAWAGYCLWRGAAGGY